MTRASTPGAGPVDTARSGWAKWQTLPSGAVTLEGGIRAKRQAVNRESALPPPPGETAEKGLVLTTRASRVDMLGGARRSLPGPAILPAAR